MSLTSISPDVLVVGGGVAGLSVAYEAARRGLTVSLLERDRIGGATTRLAAGMLAPVAEADPTETELLRLGIRSAQRYAQWVEELAERSGCDPGYTACGTLIVARDGDETEVLARSQALRERLGLAVRRLRPSQARGLEPGLAPTLRSALELPEDHAVDPRALTVALTAAARGAGVTLREGAEVMALDCRGSRVHGVRLASGERIPAGAVVVAAGVWSGSLRMPEDAMVPLRPVKGQIVRLRDPVGPGLVSRVLRLELQGVYLVPRGDGRYVLGATMEERGFDRTVTAGPLLELLREAGELVPGLTELVVEEFAAGLRPGTPDNLPALGPGVLEGLHWAAGHYRHGILLAPVSAAAVLDSLTGGEPDPSLAPFSPRRFAGDRSRPRRVLARAAR